MLSWKTRKKVRFDLNIQIYEYDTYDKALDLVVKPDGKGKEGEYDELDFGDSDLDVFNDPCGDDHHGRLKGSSLDEDDDGIVELRSTVSAPDVFIEEFDSPVLKCGSQAGRIYSIESNPYARHRRSYVHDVLNPVANLSQWRTVKAKGRSQVLGTGKENSVSNQIPKFLLLSNPSVEEFSVNFRPRAHQVKKSNVKTPRGSTSRSPHETSAIGTDGTSLKHAVPAKCSIVVQEKRENMPEQLKARCQLKYGRDRSVSDNLLLMPVENLSQWQAIKAKDASALRPKKTELCFPSRTKEMSSSVKSQPKNHRSWKP